VAELVKAAVEVDSAHDYAVADATALPFADGRFDMIVAYNVLMDLEDAARDLPRAPLLRAWNIRRYRAEFSVRFSGNLLWAATF